MTINTEILLAAFGILQAIVIAWIGWRQSKDKNRSDSRTARISQQAAVIKAQTETMVATLELAQARLDDALRHNNEQTGEIRDLRTRVRQLEVELVEVNLLRQQVAELKKENETLRTELANSKKREIELRKRIARLEQGDTGPLPAS